MVGALIVGREQKDTCNMHKPEAGNPEPLSAKANDPFKGASGVIQSRHVWGFPKTQCIYIQEHEPCTAIHETLTNKPHRNSHCRRHTHCPPGSWRDTPFALHLKEQLQSCCNAGPRCPAGVWPSQCPKTPSSQPDDTTATTPCCHCTSQP